MHTIVDLNNRPDRYFALYEYFHIESVISNTLQNLMKEGLKVAEKCIVKAMSIVDKQLENASGSFLIYF